MPPRPTDEEICPYDELLALVVRTCADFGEEPPELIIRARKGRSERVTVIFPDKSRCSMTHRSRKPGLTRLAMKRLMVDMYDKQVAEFEAKNA
jgi:hypothetical protein